MHEFSQNSSWNVRFQVSDLRRETRWFTSLNLSVNQRHLLSSWWTRCRCLGNNWRPGGPDVSHMFLATCFMFLLFLLFFISFPLSVRACVGKWRGSAAGAASVVSAEKKRKLRTFSHGKLGAQFRPIWRFFPFGQVCFPMNKCSWIFHKLKNDLINFRNYLIKFKFDDINFLEIIKLNFRQFKINILKFLEIFSEFFLFNSIIFFLNFINYSI